MATIEHIESAPQYPARTLVAGLAFIGAALVFLAGMFTPTVDYDAPAAALATIASSPDAFLKTVALDMAYAILLVPALLGAASVPRDRGVRLAYVGAALALFGNLGHFLICTVDLFALNMASPAADRAEMIALLTRTTNGVGILVVLPMMLSFVIGLVVMTVGLWRARLIPVWPLALMFAAASIDFLSFGPAGETVKTVVGTIASIWIGLALIRHARLTRAGTSGHGALAAQPQS